MKSIIFFVRPHFLPTFAVSKGNKELPKKLIRASSSREEIPIKTFIKKD